MFRSPGIWIVCAALTSCVSSGPATEIAETEVQQASDQFWATYQRGDASSLAAQFTETGIHMVPGLPDAVGRSAIRDLLQDRSEGTRISDFAIHRREIAVSGDSAYELAWYTETRHGPRESFQMEGRYSIVWKREPDNRWRVARHLFNYSAAAPVEPLPETGTGR